MELIREGTRYKGRVDVEFIAAGGLLAPVTTQDIDLSKEDYTKALKDGIVVKRLDKLDPRVGHVRVIVLDRNSYLAGTSTVAVNTR